MACHRVVRRSCPVTAVQLISFGTTVVALACVFVLLVDVKGDDDEDDEAR